MSEASYPATTRANFPVLNLSWTPLIKNCPEETPVAAVNASPHVPAETPNAVAAAELIQLPPTIIKFFEATYETSLSFTKTSPRALLETTALDEATVRVPYDSSPW